MPAPTSKPPEDQHSITCLYCGKPQEVARRAMSITCKFCNKPLKLEDIAIKQYEARRQIATCGVVTVEKKGSAITDSIKCGGPIVRGKGKGAGERHGPVLIGPEAEGKGDGTAPRVAGRYGPVRTGLVGPNRVTSGRSIAAAMCIGPLSLAMTSWARSISAASCRSDVFPARFTPPPTCSARSISSGEPATTLASPNR